LVPACNAGVFWGRANTKISVNHSRHVEFYINWIYKPVQRENDPSLKMFAIEKIHNKEHLP